MATNKSKSDASTLYYLLQIIGGCAVQVLIVNAVLTDQLRLPPGGQLPKLSTYNSKLEFILKYQAPSLFILMVCILNVIRIRVSTPARNPMAGHEVYTQAAKNILTNTFEQYIIHFVSQLVLAAYMESHLLVKVVPLMALFFFVGRLCFLLGYPTSRSFGMTLTLAPHSLAVGYCFYKFLIMIGVLL